MRTHEEEIERVREWNRNLLLEILDESALAFEKWNPMTNLKSQMAIQAFLRCVKVLAKVAYEDKELPNEMTALKRRLHSNNIERFKEEVEYNFNFIAGRRILISEIKQMYLEQKYDLIRLMAFEFPSVYCDDCYSISRSQFLPPLEGEVFTKTEPNCGEES